MSLPFTILTCTKCGEKTATTIVRGLNYYLMEDGYQVMQDKGLGWCHSCDGFRAIEVIPSMEELETEAAEAEQELNDHLRPHDWLWNYAPEWILPERIKWAAFLRNKMEEARRRILWRQQRVSPPRCLNCAGTDVEKILYGDAPHHRGCDGVLDSVVTEGFYMSAPSISLHFTPEGIYVRKVDWRNNVLPE